MKKSFEMGFSTNSRCVGLPLTIGFLLISGIVAQGQSNDDAFKRSSSQEDLLQAAESSNRGNLVRVMIRKDFQLQPDGTYQEIPSDSSKKVTLVKPLTTMEDWDESVDESAPPASYAYSPYVSYHHQPRQVSYQNHYEQPQKSAEGSKLLRFTNSDVVSHQSDSYSEPSNQYNQYYAQDYDYQASEQPQIQQSYYTLISRNDTEPSAAGSREYPKYEIKQSSGSQFYLDSNSQLQPLQSVQFSPYSTIPSSSEGYTSPQMHIITGGSTTGTGYSGGSQAPGNIQDIIKTPQAESNAAPYYSPKDQQYYEPESYVNVGGSTGGGYGSTGTGGGYSSPGSGGYNADSYGAPPVPSSHYGGSGGGYGTQSKGGAKAALVNTITHTVKGVTASKAAQVSSVLHQKGQLTSQIFNFGGQVVHAAVAQKAQKAKIVGNVLAQVPGQLSHILASKAKLATAALAHGNSKIGAIVQIKANTAKQASNLIQAKGKAASAVIKASGGTAADLIVAKGKGLANLITSGGQAASALLDHKGNKVQKLAKVLGGVSAQKAHGGYGGGSHVPSVSYGAELKGQSEGGYDDYQGPSVQYGHQRVYDELQDALKSVVESPASSYGTPPQAEQTKVSSAFRSIYENFKAGQHQPSVFPVGSHSAPVGVTAGATTTSANTQQGGGIGESLNKMSEMFNNVANVLKWFSPAKQ